MNVATATTRRLESYVKGQWVAGSGDGALLTEDRKSVV